MQIDNESYAIYTATHQEEGRQNPRAHTVNCNDENVDSGGDGDGGGRGVCRSLANDNHFG